MDNAYDKAIKIQLAEDIIAIAENYNSWSNLNSSADLFAQEVLDRLFEYGLDIEG